MTRQNSNPKIQALLSNAGSQSVIDEARREAWSLVPEGGSHCAVFLSFLLKTVLPDLRVETLAESLARELLTRGWEKIGLEAPMRGDVGVTIDANRNGLADHIYLVFETIGGQSDRVIILDNQSRHPHERSLSGKHGKTPTHYLLRAPG